MADDYVGPLALFLVSLVGALIGAYVGAYLREKGKNLATREDIDRIVRTTEDIKAEISGDLWERQNRWTFKKDLYIRLLEGLGDGASAVRQLLYLDERLKDPAHRHLIETTKQLMDENFSALTKSMVEIRHSASIAPLICTEATEEALGHLLEGWLKAEAKSGSRQYLEICQASLGEAIESVTNAARTDLRLILREAKR